jgi:hypothetical protein
MHGMKALGALPLNHRSVNSYSCFSACWVSMVDDNSKEITHSVKGGGGVLGSWQTVDVINLPKRRRNICFHITRGHFSVYLSLWSLQQMLKDARAGHCFKTFQIGRRCYTCNVFYTQCEVIFTRKVWLRANPIWYLNKKSISETFKQRCMNYYAGVKRSVRKERPACVISRYDTGILNSLTMMHM